MYHNRRSDLAQWYRSPTAILWKSCTNVSPHVSFLTSQRHRPLTNLKSIPHMPYYWIFLKKSGIQDRYFFCVWMMKRRLRRHLVQGVSMECWMTTTYFVLTDWVGGLCSLGVLTITTNNDLRKPVYTKMSKTEGMLVSQLSSLFYRRVSYIFQLTECNKTRLIFADAGPSSINLVGFNFSSSLTYSHFSMKKTFFFIKTRSQFYLFQTTKPLLYERV